MPERRPVPAAAAQQRGHFALQRRGGIQCAHAFGAADFMGTQGNEICPVLLRVQRNFQKGLHRIGVQQRPALSGFELAGDLRDGIYVSRFIVYSHDGYQCRVLPQGRLHLVSGDAPGVVGLEIRYLIPLLGQGLARFQYGAVFHGGGDDMPPGVTSDMQPLRGWPSYHSRCRRK